MKNTRWLQICTLMLCPIAIERTSGCMLREPKMREARYVVADRLLTRAARKQPALCRPENRLNGFGGLLILVQLALKLGYACRNGHGARFRTCPSWPPPTLHEDALQCRIE